MATSYFKPAKLPPDIREASWMWSHELPHRRLPWGGIQVTGRVRATLSCRIVLIDTDDYTDFVVEASGDGGQQRESFSFRRRRPIVHPPSFDGNVAVQTSCGIMRGRMMCYAVNGRCDVYAEPGSVVAFVKALEMFTRDEVWF